MGILRVTSGPGEGDSINLDGDVVVGREGADLTINDPELSRRHVMFRPSDDGVVVEDLGSTNGTVVNGSRITEPVTLVRDASVKIGQTVLTLELELGGATVVRSAPTVLRSTQPATSPAGPPVGAPPGGPPAGGQPAGMPAGGRPAGGPPGGGPPAGMPAGGRPAGGPPAGGPPAGMPAGGPPGGPPGGRPGGPPGGPPGAPGPRTPGRKIPEFVPWTVAAAAIVVAVVVAITSGSSSKTVSTKPPPAVGIVPFASSVLQPVTFTRTMPNGVKLTISTTGTMQVGVQRLILQPGGFEPWHEHPGSGLAIVEQGTIDDYEQNAKGTGCTLFQLSAGQARFDPGNNPHSLVNPTKKPVTVWVATFAPPHTAPLTSKPKPAGCAAP